MATKSKGEWEAETISEWAGSDTSVWRAQKSTAPDGKVFIGVRQYIKTKTYDGPGKAGISFALDGDAEEAMTQMMNLFRDLRTQITDGGIAVAKKRNRLKETIAAAKKVAKAIHGSPQFYLQKNNGKYLTSVSADAGVKVSSDADKAQLFTKARAQALLDKTLSDAWSMYAHTD